MNKNAFTEADFLKWITIISTLILIGIIIYATAEKFGLIQ